MEQTWFDLPVESRLTEIWPKGVLQKNKFVPMTCKPKDMSFPVPYWNLPVIPMDQKMPLLPGPDDLHNLTRSKLGQRLWMCEDSGFSLNEFIPKEVFNAYEILHDPNLAHYLTRPSVIQRLKELGLINSQLSVKCNLKDYNQFRLYLAFVHTNAINKLFRQQFIRGVNLNHLMTNLKKQNARERLVGEIAERHQEVLKEITEEKRKKEERCDNRLRRVEEAYARKIFDLAAKKIAARESAKDYTKKVQDAKYYSNLLLMKHRLDTIRKWKLQNKDKSAFLEQKRKQFKQILDDKKWIWFEKKIRHQEKRILHETQINVLMDHKFSPEYKHYLKYIKGENYKNPPDESLGSEYDDVTSTSEDEGISDDLLNQFKRNKKPGRQLRKDSLTSRMGNRQNMAKLLSFILKKSNMDAFAHMSTLRYLIKSEKHTKEKQDEKSKSKKMLNALISTGIPRYLSPSLQAIFMKSNPKPERNKETVYPTEMRPDQNRRSRCMSAVDAQSFRSKKNTNLDKIDQDNQSETGLFDISDLEIAEEDFEIEIKPPNKSKPPLPVFHLNVYRYLDRVLGKVILEYVSRIILPKFPEIINRCFWVAKAEGLPEDIVDKVCHPEDSSDSYTQCMEVMKDICDQKMTPYLLLLQESHDIRLFRHKFNGIGGVSCPESLVGNFLVQLSPHPQHMLDYIHWRADWILNYPAPRTYQELYDLKYVVGVMRNIECPVFKIIYKLWEISNDINLNPIVHKKFRHYMEKKGAKKSLLELSPIDITVKNINKIIDSLKLDYQDITDVDDLCFKDYFKLPSELFCMTYLKKPIDPKIWETLDRLLDEATVNPENFNCLSCLPDNREQTSQNTAFEDFETIAPGCLFIDPHDYEEEIRNAKEKIRSDNKIPQLVSFGVTEFIPFIENQLFGKEKEPVIIPEKLKAEEKNFTPAEKVKVPSILKTSILVENEISVKRKKSLSKEAATANISHKKKETNLHPKPVGSNDTDRKKTADKKKTDTAKKTVNEKISEPTGIQNMVNGTNETADSNSALNAPNGEDSSIHEKREVRDNFASKTRPKSNVISNKALAKPHQTSQSKSNKGSANSPKSKKLVENESGKGMREHEKSHVLTNTKPDSRLDANISKENTKPTKMMQVKSSKKAEHFKTSTVIPKLSSVGYPGELLTSAKEKNPVIKIAEITDSLKLTPINEEPDQKLLSVHSVAKSDLTVKFLSTKYVKPNILKSLEVCEELKKSKERAPTPHPSFTSLVNSHDRKKSVDLSNIFKAKLCEYATTESDDNLDIASSISGTRKLDHTGKNGEMKEDFVLTEPDYTKKRNISTQLDKTNNVNATERQTHGSEVVLNVTQPNLEQKSSIVHEQEEKQHSLGSIESDIDDLRKYVEKKLAPKLVTKDKSKFEVTLPEQVPVPPLINKCLLARRRLLKRPLANILRKIYGWVMTTFIRRRLLTSYGLPSVIYKECFYKKKI